MEVSSPTPFATLVCRQPTHVSEQPSKQPKQVYLYNKRFTEATAIGRNKVTQNEYLQIALQPLCWAWEKCNSVKSLADATKQRQETQLAKLLRCECSPCVKSRCFGKNQFVLKRICFPGDRDAFLNKSVHWMPQRSGQVHAPLPWPPWPAVSAMEPERAV